MIVLLIKIFNLMRLYEHWTLCIHLKIVQWLHYMRFRYIDKINI